MTVEEKLDEAEKAYHKLLLGQSAVEIRDSNGELVRYTPASRNSLAAYIADLKRQLGSSSGPLQVWG